MNVLSLLFVVCLAWFVCACLLSLLCCLQWFVRSFVVVFCAVLLFAFWVGLVSLGG